MLTQCGYEFTCNRSGSNVATGVASSLIANSTLFGKPKKDLAVFELDERSAPRILPFIKPDLLLCTNIFRDSYKRNAHVEFILDILNTYIPDSTKLVLNADDLLCSSLKPSNRRVFFSIDPLPNEMCIRDRERKIYKGVSANVDFYSGFIYSMLDLPMELYTPIFAIARIAGWSAHRMEELIGGGKIIRPAYMAVQPHRDFPQD